jgi:GH3 auxin-responsive promoter
VKCSSLAVNSAWALAGIPAWLRFRAALGRAEREQRRVLASCIRRNAGTAYGRAHGFAGIRSAEEYRSRVPLTTYDDYQPLVERIAAGEAGVLTAEPVKLLEPSSGSTAAAKLIPYTRSLRAEFGRAIAPWIVDLFLRDPALAAGPGYWSVSPAIARKRTAGGVPVGFEDDSQYLGGLLGRLVGAALAVPAEVRHVADMKSFRYVTLLFLLRCRELRLISVWHPSFLTLLLDALAPNWDRLLEDLAAGSVRPPRALPLSLGARLGARLRPDRRRAAELSGLRPEETWKIWPRLRLLSAWGDSHAAMSLPELRRALPAPRLQPKGLIATEAFVSLPFGGERLLAVRSHFFEFLTDDGGSLMAHQVEVGGVYSVAVTTGGGLYRYRLRDRVRVTGFSGHTPALCFLGKEDGISDLRGEKLSEDHVAGVLARVLTGLNVRFAMLAPEFSARAPGYSLFLESAAAPSASLEQELEAALGANPHYRYCVELGQLRPVRVVRLAAGGVDAYLRRCRELGQRPGDVKPRALSPRCDWAKVLGVSRRATSAAAAAELVSR